MLKTILLVLRNRTYCYILFMGICGIVALVAISLAVVLPLLYLMFG